MYGIEDYELYVDEYSVEDVRADLHRIVDYFRAMDYHQHACKLFLEDTRELPSTVESEYEVFCVDENTPIGSLPDWMKSESLGFVRGNFIPQSGRCVFPVKDVLGQVMGFVGWDPTCEPKYLDSKNYGYKAKATTLFGMEKLPEYYMSNEPVFITEGLMCTVYLRCQGFQAMASLGSWLTPYVIQILKRFGSRLIAIPDNDETGDKYVKQLKRALPKACVMQVTKGKDIDGCRRLEEHKYEEQLLRDLRGLSNPFYWTSPLVIRR